jgi:methionine aminotransferase
MTTLATEVGAINLAQGFPDFPVDPVLIDHVTQAMRDGHNQYAPMPGVLALREMLSVSISDTHGVVYDPDSEITITSGATVGIYSAIAANVHQGDEVILFEPAYDSYAPSVRANGGTPRAIRCDAPDYTPDWNAVRAAITPRTKMIVINTPHNPTGTVWSRADMHTLRDIAVEYDVCVISDEVYHHITFDGITHVSAGSIEGLRERTYVVTSFGKTFHATGWKIGAVCAPPALMQPFRDVFQFLAFSTHTPTQVALARYMQGATPWRDVGAFYQAKRDLFRSLIAGSRWTLRPSQGSYFQLLGYENISTEDDMTLAKRLTRELGVASIPLSPFMSTAQPDTVLRFCFAKEDRTLEEAARLLGGV